MHPTVPFPRWLRAIPARFAAADACYRDERRLADVSDRLLADIGLTRDDVRAPGVTRRR